MAKLEERVLARQDELEAKLNELLRREQGLADREVHIKELQQQLKDAKDEELQELERISGLTVNEARQRAARPVGAADPPRSGPAGPPARGGGADRCQATGPKPRRRRAPAGGGKPRRRDDLIGRRAASDDMKGRIIGREGRNIRTLEHLTGVDIIIDDTPQAVVLSSFDGIRREIAKLTLSKLIEDGRIQPARIEEMYYQSKAEIDDHIRAAGEQAVFEANCGDFHPELVKILGRLHYRTSYGQNVLKHTLEVVHLAGIMAMELEASVRTAKRAALLHDLGKALTHEVEGSHAQISAEYAARYGETEAVVHAIAAHHYEVQPQTVEAVLLIAADAISGSRPGARGDTLENYIKRLEALEEIAARKNGVEKVYALQAGREIRVIVKPGEIDDDAAVLLSHEIARDIEQELEYPGQIKVTVIRESRATELAK